MGGAPYLVSCLPHPLCTWHSGFLSRAGDVGWVHLLPPALPALGIHKTQHKRPICWKGKKKIRDGESN